MLSFAGSDPFKTTMEASLRNALATKNALELPFSVLPLDDRELCIEGSPWKSVDKKLLLLVTDRSALRRHCRDAGLIVPAGVEGMELESLARWAMQFRRFPLALKSCRNGSGGRGVYRLEGFRELTTFFERLRNKDEEAGPLRIEEWIEAKALIELTVGTDGFRMTSQIGREPNLTGRTAWRMYPVNVPAPLRPGMEKILEAFSALLSRGKGQVLRFTIALTGKEVVLLSLNAGFNRLEYLPDWAAESQEAGKDASFWQLLGQPMQQQLHPSDSQTLNTAQTSVLSSSQDRRNLSPTNFIKEKSDFSPGEKLRLQFFRRSNKDEAFPSTLPKPAKALPIRRYAASGRRAVALLAGEDASALNRSAKLLQTLLAAEDPELGDRIQNS